MSRELLKRAAVILHDHFDGVNWAEPLLNDIDNELAQPNPDPIAYITGWYGGYQTINVITGAVLPNGTALYTVPPTQKPLTDDEIIQIAMKVAVEAGADHISVEDIKNPSSGVMQLARALETAHGITP